MVQCGHKGLLWAAWAVNTLASAVFCGTAMVTFHNVQQGMDRLTGVPNRGAFEGSLLAACMLGFLVVLFFMILSFIVLLGKVFGEVKFAYGWMVGACLNTGFYTLLSALVLNSQEHIAELLKDAKIWSSYDYQTYVACFAFGYILCGSYFLFFILLMTMRTKEYAARSSSYTLTETNKPAAGGIPMGSISAPGPSAPPAPASGSGAGAAQWGGNQGAWGHAQYGNQV